MILRLSFLLLFIIPCSVWAQQAQRIIDVHLHINEFPLPYGFCSLSGLLGTKDIDGSNICESPLVAAKTKAELINRSLELMRKHNIVGAVVSSREFGLVNEWAEKSEYETIKAIQLGELDIDEKYKKQANSIIGEEAVDTDITSSDDPTALFDIPQLANLIENEGLRCLGEITTQYDGIPPNSAILDPVYRLAVEYDIPVAIHIAGFGAPRPGYNISYGNPLMLEDVLTKYPDLRIYVMHMGFPFVDEMAMIMRRYKNVYVDISAVSWMMPRTVYYSHLKKLIDYGLGKRIMFGTDQVWWPDAITVAVEGVKEAPFLSEEQKTDIFYNNAARFFRLDN